MCKRCTVTLGHNGRGIPVYQPREAPSVPSPEYLAQYLRGSRDGFREAKTGVALPGLKPLSTGYAEGYADGVSRANLP